MAARRPIRAVQPSLRMLEAQETNLEMTATKDRPPKKPKLTKATGDKTNALLETLVNDVKVISQRLETLENAGNARPPTYSKGKSSAGLATRVGFTFIDQDVKDDVLNGTFDAYDLWKLDEFRVSILAPPTRPESTVELFRRYPNVGCLVRPWTVYAQLRDIIDPGIHYFLSFHTRHLLTLNAKYPGNMTAIVSYHFGSTSRRLERGCEREEWGNLDVVTLTMEVLPLIGSSQTVAAGETRPLKFDPLKRGSQTSQEWCSEYVNQRGCEHNTCTRRHGCFNCGFDVGHTAMGNCPRKVSVSAAQERPKNLLPNLNRPIPHYPSSGLPNPQFDSSLLQWSNANGQHSGSYGASSTYQPMPNQPGPSTWQQKGSQQPTNGTYMWQPPETGSDVMLTVPRGFTPVGPQTAFVGMKSEFTGQSGPSNAQQSQTTSDADKIFTGNAFASPVFTFNGVVDNSQTNINGGFPAEG